MKNLLLVAVVAFTVACGDSKKGTDDEVQAKCDVAGKQRCTGAVRQECGDALVWEAVETCTGVCEEESAYVTVCGLADGEYTYEGFTASNALAFFNSDLFGYHKVEGTDSASAPTMALSIENYPEELWEGAGFGDALSGTSKTVSLSGANASYATCGTCIIVQRQVDDDVLLFFAQSGDVTGVLPSEVGQPASVTLSNVVLREVTFGSGGATNNVSGGATWFIESLELLNETALLPYTCDAINDLFEEDPGVEWLPGDQLCLAGEESGDLVVSCEESFPEEFPGIGFIAPTDECAEGQECVNTTPEEMGEEDNYTAECQVPVEEPVEE